MERVRLYRDGIWTGDITFQTEGVCVHIRAAMDNPGDGLYRVFLQGEQGELPLGVLEPADGELVLRRKIYRRELDGLGTLQRGEARQSFSFGGGERWQRTNHPAALLADPFFRRRLETASLGWWRREEGALLLALPLEPGDPFPLETLFCLARIQPVEGRLSVVYRFDKDGKPEIVRK